ncbi:MAG: beta-N-acetylhexosaminidase, partial [Gemmatimonadota bacterium]
MATTRIYWQTKSTPAELRGLLAELGRTYPIAQGEGRGLQVAFEKAPEPGLLEVRRQGGQATVRYGATAQAGRAVGALLADGLVADGRALRESTPFRSFGIMLDCSRNAVMKVEHFKRWLRQLALLGYDTVMLYTEDTYELPGEPYFGYQRGPYTAAELKEVDGYAARLNIELIPCIQTLGHLANVLRHAAYRDVKDTSSVMLVGEKKTYQLIEKMLTRWREVCRTDRMHLGMDETHDLGRGRYLDRNGYRDGFELFNQHLAKVVQLCRKHGYEPMIWSDMYFRLGSKNGDYYDQQTKIPPSVVKKIPKAAELVYWDYYHADAAFYLDWIERHRQLGKDPIMGSGIWTWSRYWYDRHITERTAGPCIDACRQAEVKEVFFTQWGDNGA